MAAVSDPASLVEDAIIDRLSPLVADGIYVRNRAQSNQQAKAMAMLTVVLVSGRAIATQPKNRQTPLHQNLSCKVIAEFQNQRTHKDAYPTIYAIGGLLHGFIPVGAIAGVMLWDGFSYENYDQASKVYQWGLDFTIPIEFRLPRL